jgi:HK97 family phage portal protein
MILERVGNVADLTSGAVKSMLDVFVGPQLQLTQGSGFIAKFLPSMAGAPKTTEDILKFFGQSPLLRMVGGRIAQDVASQTWNVYTPTSRKAADIRHARKIALMPVKKRHEEIKYAVNSGDMKEIDQHPILNILYRGNDVMLGSVFRKLTQLHLDLVGEAFWLLVRNRAGVPFQAFLVPPSWVASTPTSQNGNTFEVRYGQLQLDVPAEEMVWFLDPNPATPYERGLGTGKVLADELEIEEFATKHVKTFFLNRARPEVLITGPNLSKESADRLEARWLERLQGFQRAYMPFFMNAPDGMKLHELSQDFESMQLMELRKHERDMVIQTFGVPPEVFGVIENSNRSTIDAADYLMAKHVLVPRLDVLRETMNETIMLEYGDESVVLDYDSPVDQDKEFNYKVAKAAPYSRTVDEWRELQGLDKIDGGEQRYIPNNYIGVDQLAALTDNGEQDTQQENIESDTSDS